MKKLFFSLIFIVSSFLVLGAFNKNALSPEKVYLGDINEIPLELQQSENYFQSQNTLTNANISYDELEQESIRAVSGISPKILESYTYTPYGERAIYNRYGGRRSTTSKTNIGFTGRYLDEETGLYYFRARYYDTNQGRFISCDPTGYVDGMGLYNGYFASQFMMDPNGRWSTKAHNKLLEHALKGKISQKDIKALQKASKDFDKKTQLSDESYKHSMRRKGESIKESKERTKKFIKDKIKKAKEFKKKGNHKAALKELGEALHPVMDSSSPMHTDSKGNPKTWNPWGHSPNDWFGDETSNDITDKVYKEMDKIISAIIESTIIESEKCP